MTELLPCPFCGGNSYHFIADQGDKWGHVMCGCGACGPEVRTGYHEDAWHPEAIKEWNARNAPAQCAGTADDAKQLLNIAEIIEDDPEWFVAIDIDDDQLAALFRQAAAAMTEGGR